MGLSSMESLGPTWPEVQSVRILLFIKKGGCPAVKKLRPKMENTAKRRF